MNKKKYTPPKVEFFAYITLDGGVFTADNSNEGLYIFGSEITISAPKINRSGVYFSHWKNSSGDRVSANTTFTFIVERNERYTAVYQSYSHGRQ